VKGICGANRQRNALFGLFRRMSVLVYNERTTRRRPLRCQRVAPRALLRHGAMLTVIILVSWCAGGWRCWRRRRRLGRKTAAYYVQHEYVGVPGLPYLLDILLILLLSATYSAATISCRRYLRNGASRYESSSLSISAYCIIVALDNAGCGRRGAETVERRKKSTASGR